MVTSKWVCGFYSNGIPAALELQGRLTEKMFLIDTDHDGGESYRKASWIISYAKRLRLDDNMLFDTREQAITAAVAKHTAQMEAATKKADDEMEKILLLKRLRAEASLTS